MWHLVTTLWFLKLIPSDRSHVWKYCTLPQRRQLPCQPEKPDEIVVEKVETDGQSQSDFWVLPVKKKMHTFTRMSLRIDTDGGVLIILGLIGFPFQKFERTRQKLMLLVIYQ